jgi:hypothetical protein
MMIVMIMMMTVMIIMMMMGVLGVNHNVTVLSKPHSFLGPSACIKQYCTAQGYTNSGKVNNNGTMRPFGLSDACCPNEKTSKQIHILQCVL